MYFMKDTKLPQFMPQPVFLQNMALSISARQLYTLLLNRTTLSQKNDWVDEEGRVYVIYTVENMAADLGRSRRTVGRALNELEEAGLIERIHRGLTMPNHIYICMPADQEKTKVSALEKTCTPKETKVSAPEGAEMSAPERSELSRPNGSHWPTNHTEKNQTEQNQLRGEGAERPPLRAYGYYKNIFLTWEQRQCLDRQYGANRVKDCVDGLSEYMKATGKTYADHEAAVRKWLRDDKKKTSTVPDRWSVNIDYSDYEDWEVL